MEFAYDGGGMGKGGSVTLYTEHAGGVQPLRGGLGHATGTRYQSTKQVASHWGGTPNGTIVHWPTGIAARGEVRSQFTHVIDVAPTVLLLPASRSRPT